MAIKDDAAYRRVEFVAKYLREHATPSDTVQVLDTVGGGINSLLRAEMRLPTRFIYDFHFYAHDPSLPYVSALRQEFMHGMIEHKPHFVVFYEKTWMLPGYNRLNKFPEFAAWLDHNYVMRVNTNVYRIYESRNR